MIHDVARERARALEEKYGWWGRHPDYLLEDWQQAVANDDTRFGYWDWVAVSMSAAAEEEDAEEEDGEEDDEEEDLDDDEPTHGSAHLRYYEGEGFEDG